MPLLRVLRHLSISILALAPHAAPALGQRPDPPFDTLRVGIAAVGNINRNQFHEYWSPDVGIELAASVPFYAGRIEVGGHYASFEGRESAQPDFSTLYLFLGWGERFSLGSALAWSVGLRAGSFLMFYDTPSDNTLEQELAVGANTGIAYTIAGPWSLAVSLRYRRVFTHQRLDYVFIAAGVERAFPAPGWLRHVLE